MSGLTYQRRTCVRPSGASVSVVVIVDQSGRTVEQLVLEARARVEPPDPSLGTLPDYTEGHAVIVQTPLWVWTEDPVSETASAGTGITVSVTSQLQRIDLRLTGSDYTESWSCDEDQVQVSWEALGLSADDWMEPERFNACHVVVERSSTGEPGNLFNLRASAVWTFTFTVNGAGPFAIPGSVVKTADFPVDAIEYLVIED